MTGPSLYDYYYYAGGPGGVVPPPADFDQAFAMAGAGQLAQVGGPLITRPGEVVPDMAALLFHRPDITNPVAVLADAMGQTFQDRHKELGTGEVTLLNTDPDLGAVWDAECVVRFEIMGRAAFTMIVNELDHVAIAEGEEHDQTTKLAGRAHISVLEESVVYPPTGPDTKPFSDERIFSWPSPDLNDSWWGLTDALVTQSTPPLFPGGGTRPPLIDPTGPNGSYWETAVADDWPDPAAWWMWAHWPNNREWAPAGTCYFRKRFTVPDGFRIEQLMIYAVLDDEGEVWLDGIQLLDCTYGVEPVGVYTTLVDITPGEHTLAIKCTNMVDPEGDEVHNPGGVLFTAFPVDGVGQFLADHDAVVRSDDTWLIVEYPPQPPGFTPGEVIRHVIEEGQARGCFPEITLGFDDVFDAAGNPWTITGSISTKTSTNLWTFIGEELATTYVDIWMGPGDFCLFAWIHDGRGRDRPVTLTGVTDEMDPMSGNLRGLTHHTIR